MISLFDTDRKTIDRKSSKGNQLKFERDGIWYKADNMGYEGLSEYVVANLLKHSDLAADEFAGYELEEIEYNGIIYPGCKSCDFTEGWKLITLERLFKTFFGKSLNKMIYSIEDHSERLRQLVYQVERVTGIENFGLYMNKILTIDALFLNEDRHTHNIAVMMNDKKEFRLCPIFDNGAALLSDTKMDYPLDRDCFTYIDKVKAATFCDSFEEQLEISEKLFGQCIHFSYDEKTAKTIIDAAAIYDEEVKKRVFDVIMQMRRKYKYIFK
ncbi:hypothetical protein [Butyrivibrio sp. MC2021]|uniref:hypothetical protein n=1 Tax=Butyrivibrio sp. MC2021 TaxID=1408306 RepID=UPI00047B8BDE|nr:hypothetical protein [Butyrivibrio sp. MC2021]